jgi:hypothetical protein
MRKFVRALLGGLMMVFAVSVTAQPPSPGTPRPFIYLNQNGIWDIGEEIGSKPLKYQGYCSYIFVEDNERYYHRLIYQKIIKIRDGGHEYRGWMYKHPDDDFYFFFSMHPVPGSRDKHYVLAYSFSDDPDDFKRFRTQSSTYAQDLKDMSLQVGAGGYTSATGKDTGAPHKKRNK